MIGFLVGTLVEKAAPQVLLDVNGVGYEVQVSLTTSSQLPELGSTVRLLTHLVVREDAHMLYGFAESSERKLFKSLIKVNGVGPKLALTILSGVDAKGFMRCVVTDDIKSLVQLPGVGKKTAERLIMEMKDRIQEWQIDSEEKSVASKAVESPQASLMAEAETALIALGYKPTEASKMLAGFNVEDYNKAEDLIRAALQSMLSR